MTTTIKPSEIVTLLLKKIESEYPRGVNDRTVYGLKTHLADNLLILSSERIKELGEVLYDYANSKMEPLFKFCGLEKEFNELLPNSNFNGTMCDWIYSGNCAGSQSRDRWFALRHELESLQKAGY